METPTSPHAAPARGVGQNFARGLAFLLLLLAGTVAHPPALRADDAVRAAQSVLAARGFYFGTPDGQPGASTADAVRRFQIREGLPVTGRLDDPTARALGVPGPTAAAAAGSAKATPPPPPPAGADADRDFLRQSGLVTTASPTVPANRPPPSPRPTAPAPAAPSPAPRAPRPTGTPAAPAADPNVFTNLPPASRDVARSSVEDVAITPDEAAVFLRRYLTAGAGDDPVAEAAFFARDVDYFNNGRVSRRFIERDQSAYRRRWPFRRYQLEREPELVGPSLPDGSVGVRYRLRYNVESPARVTSGRTVGEIRIRRVPGGGFEIVSIKETPL